jgi:hypothetical protein
VAADHRPHQIDVVNHEIEHDGDVGATRIERREAIALDEPGRAHVRQRRPNGAVESLDVAGLHDHTRSPREREQLVRLLEADRDWLLDEDVLSTFQGCLRDDVMRRSRHDDRDCVRLVEQLR